MRRLVRLSAVGVGLCCALFVGSPAATAANSPETGVQMCSEHVNPGLFGGLFPTAGSQSKGCMSSTALVTE
ncbi:hypothetical protein F0L17_24745 [Streptomyces sp. TRM43335]|uniref:Secreted protein n=1 Tax=Streptomyces taklimakanensis TaxID=2569853 RepID=A0A6G2BIZ2_9ACTN|nr:hypothetical protein [Streptomyces taklimakanensis]MTE22251.1 hypothetical protein [Streptomyces taklimakanensis]